MTNRFSTYSSTVIRFLPRRSDRFFSFYEEQFYCFELDQKLLELEHRAGFRESLKPKTAAASRLPDSRKAYRRKPDQPSFDESGFPSSFEIDTRWI